MKIKDVSNGASNQECFLSCFVFLVLKILNATGKSREQYNKHPCIPKLANVNPSDFFPFLSKDTVGVPFVHLPGPILLCIPGDTTNMHLVHLLESGLLF